MTMTLPRSGAVRGDLAPVPEAWAAAAKAKLERDRKSYQAFRAADQQQHERAWKQHHDAVVAAAEKSAGLHQMNVETVEPLALAALEASRAADDRARDAREYARTQQAKAERFQEDKTSSAEKATDAQVRADTADGVAARREAEAVKAREELEGLELDLAGARESLDTAERDLRAARKAAEAPAGTAPISEVTIRFNASYMQADEVWDQLAERDRFRVRQAGEPRNMLSDEEFRASMREILGRNGTAV